MPKTQSNIKLDFLEKIAFYVVKGEPEALLPDIAMQGLDENYETPSLLILAGLRVDENPFVLDQYFKKALEELNIIALAERNQAAFFLVKSIVKKILYDYVDEYEGCDFIFEHVLSMTNFREQDNKFAYDSIGLENVYSLYLSIEELMNASTRWDEMKSNDQLLEEAKSDIKTILMAWENDDLSTTCQK